MESFYLSSNDNSSTDHYNFQRQSSKNSGIGESSDANYLGNDNVYSSSSFQDLASSGYAPAFEGNYSPFGVQNAALPLGRPFYAVTPMENQTQKQLTQALVPLTRNQTEHSSFKNSINIAEGIDDDLEKVCKVEGGADDYFLI